MATAEQSGWKALQEEKKKAIMGVVSERAKKREKKGAGG